VIDTMLRRGDRITDWIARVQADPLPALHSLATGLRRDLDAVIATTVTPHRTARRDP
jgi:hypothetical protein